VPGSAQSLVLLLAAAGFIGFGAAYALRPDRMAALTDLPLPSPTARADFVATYGGLQLGFGLFLLACTRQAEWTRPGLWALVAGLGGLASLRALTIVRHRGQVRSTILLGLGLELLGLALGLWALFADPSAATHGATAMFGTATMPTPTLTPHFPGGHFRASRPPLPPP
jgi:hypothetical protein